MMKSQHTEMSSDGSRLRLIRRAAWSIGAGTAMALLVAAPALADGPRIAAGDTHACAVTEDGAAKCWGHNYNGQLGDGTRTDRHKATVVRGLGSGVVAIAAGGYHTCALTEAGRVKCWGDNIAGQVGDGTTTLRTTPVAVKGLESDVVAITAGIYHTCALTVAGAAMCWGSNFDGELGDGTTTRRPLPTLVKNFP